MGVVGPVSASYSYSNVVTIPEGFVGHDVTMMKCDPIGWSLGDIITWQGKL